MGLATRALRIGTRGSPLALVQARAARARLAEAQGWPEDAIEIVVIRTTGDTIQDRALSEAGGKGLFTKELDAALVGGDIDLAVHSAKDLPTLLPDAIAIAGYLPREDVRDAFVSSRFDSLAALPAGAVVGTASLRRQAQVLRLRPDLRVRLLRGNVETRLRRIDEGAFDATLLALAGLKRLGLAHRATAVLDVVDFLPAVGQGAVAVTARADDVRTGILAAPIFDAATGTAVSCERAFLAVLDGSCRTPIAGHAELRGDVVAFAGLLLTPDGSGAIETRMQGAAGWPARLGEEAGRDVLSRAPAPVLAPFRDAGIE